MDNIVGGKVVWTLDALDSDFNEALDKAKRKINDVADDGAKSFKGMSDKMSSSLKNLSDSLNKAGDGLLKIGAGPSALLGLAVKSAIDFEDSFTGVRKTVDASDAEFQQLATNLRNISKTTPLAVNDLNNIAEIAGQLGIRGVDNLTKFTETIAKIGVTTVLTEQEAATAFGSIMNVMQEPIENVDRLASTVVDLGNKFNANERQISDFMQRIAGAGKVVGLTTAQVAGISTAFASVGVEAEAGGTAVQKVLIEMQKSAVLGGDKLSAFAKVAGVSSSDFQKAWKADPGKAFDSFVKGIASRGDEAVQVFEEIGMQDVRLIRGFLSVANAGDTLTRALGTGTEAWKGNIALNVEAEKRFATTSSQAKIFRNNISDIGITIGSVVLPKMNDMLDRLSPIIDGFAEFAEKHPNLIAGLLGVGAALATVGAGLKAVSFVLGGFGDLVKVAGDVAKLNKSLGATDKLARAFSTGLRIASAGASTFSRVMVTSVIPAIWGVTTALLANPITWIIIGIIAVITLLALAWKNNWGDIQGKTKVVLAWMAEKLEWFRNLPDTISKKWNKFKDDMGNLWEGVKTTISDKITDIGEFISGIPEKIRGFVRSIPGILRDAIVNGALAIAYGLGYLVGLIFVGIVGLVSLFIGLGGKIVNAISSGWGAFTTWWSSTWQNVKTSTIEAVTAMVDGVVAFVTSIPERISTAWTAFTVWWSATWEALKTNTILTVTNIVNGIINWFLTLPERIRILLTNVKDAFIEWGTNIWNYLVENVPKWIDNIINWILSLPTRASEALSNFGTTLKTSFTNAWDTVIAEVKTWPGRLKEWGLNMGKAFVEGVKNALGGLKDAFVRGFNDARGSVEGKSPPKEGPFKEIDKWGYNVGKAWIDGFNEALSGFSSNLSDRVSLDNPMSMNVAPAYDSSLRGGNVDIHVANMNINEEADAKRVGREIGFRIGINPSMPVR